MKVKKNVNDAVKERQMWIFASFLLIVSFFTIICGKYFNIFYTDSLKKMEKIVSYTENDRQFQIAYKVSGEDNEIKIARLN